MILPRISLLSCYFELHTPRWFRPEAAHQIFLDLTFNMYQNPRSAPGHAPARAPYLYIYMEFLDFALNMSQNPASAPGRAPARAPYICGFGPRSTKLVLSIPAVFQVIYI